MHDHSIHRAPYGTWKSPITPEDVAIHSLAAGVEDVILDPITSKVYIAQKRPEENGRSAIVDVSDHKDLFDGHWDARTKVHEYGGAASIVYDGILYFSNYSDNRVYMTRKGETPTAITPDDPVLRYASLCVHPVHKNLIVCTVEDHTHSHPSKVKTYLAVIDSSMRTFTRLIEGADFYLCARFSPDGEYLAWQQWCFPDFPFQSAEIYIAPVIFLASSLLGNLPRYKLTLGPRVHVAGKSDKISAVDPIWSSSNSIFFVSDKSGYHNPWQFKFKRSRSKPHLKTNVQLYKGKARPILSEPIEEEFGSAIQWWMSRSGAGTLSSTKFVFLSYRDGRSVLSVVDTTSRTRSEISTNFVDIKYMHGDGKGKVVYIGQPNDAEEQLMEVKLLSTSEVPVMNPIALHGIAKWGLFKLPKSYISPGIYHKLDLNGRTCHINYYAPKNPRYKCGRESEKPPTIVYIHGGPYLMTFSNLDWGKQFFTTRGWAYVDVNYGGSSGFGRKFRETLHGQWGILDVKDAHETVEELANRGLVDRHRAVVHGGSAGGYTVLQLAITEETRTVFSAGSPHYGVSDMRRLAKILHKFEYYLCDRLMGCTWEECKSVWVERSPIYHARKIIMPMLVLQGEVDTVVPAEQMKEMVKTIEESGGVVKLILFPNEGHGWRYASTIETATREQLKFFNFILGLVND